MAKNRILYVVSTLSKTGPIVVLSNIVKYLDRKQFEPAILTLSPEPKNTMIANFTDTLGIKVESLELSRFRGIIEATTRVKRYVTINRVELIHAHGLRPDWMVQGLKVPRVSTLHNYPFYDYTLLYGKIPGTIVAAMHLRCLKKIDHPVVVSRAVSEMLRERNHYEIGFVRNGVDIAKSECIEKYSLRDKLGIDKHAKVFISVGLLSSRKDPMTILNSFLKAQIADAILIFLGDGEFRQACESRAIGNPKILWMGNVDNVHEYLCASDYFLSASVAEGLPNSVLEAMSAGLPCLLSDIPPHREIHDIDPESSLLFKVKDEMDMALKMKAISEMDWNKMHEGSINITRNYLSAEIMSHQYQEIYCRLLNRELCK